LEEAVWGGGFIVMSKHKRQRQKSKRSNENAPLFTMMWSYCQKATNYDEKRYGGIWGLDGFVITVSSFIFLTSTLYTHTHYTRL